MIDRLNFFDIYGYLLPGSVFVLIVCLPSVLLNPQILSIDIGSGLVAIVVAYVVGFQLYGLAELTLLSKLRIAGKLKHFSEFILYDDDPTNTFGSDEFRSKLRSAIQGFFEVKGDEHRLFLAARGVLLQKKLATYVEQSQGMYVMARGLTLVCGLGICYLLGWLAVALPVGLRPSRGVAAGVAALFSTVAIAGTSVLWWAKRRVGALPPRIVRAFRLASENDRDTLERKAAWWVVAGLGGFLLVTGVWRAQPVSATPVAMALAAAVFGCVLTALRCYTAFRHFALLFAKTVYNDFYVMLRDARPQKSAATRWIP